MTAAKLVLGDARAGRSTPPAERERGGFFLARHLGWVLLATTVALAAALVWMESGA